MDRKRKEYRVFRQLVQMIPGFEERLMTGSEEDVLHFADLVCLISKSIGA